MEKRHIIFAVADFVENFPRIEETRAKRELPEFLQPAIAS